MTVQRYDLALEFSGGFPAPTLEEATAGNPCHGALDAVGEPSLTYPAQMQTLSGAGTWNGTALSLAVGGSGARAIVLPPAAHVGDCVEIFDSAGTAGAGTITITPTPAGTINGSATMTLTSNYQAKRVRYTATNTWVRMT